MVDWTFSIRWLDDKHIMLSFQKGDTEHNIPLPVINYVEFMELAQSFNINFREQLDDQIVKHYLNG